MNNNFRKTAIYFLFLFLLLLLLTFCSKDFSNAPESKQVGEQVVLISELTASATNAIIGGAQVVIRAKLSDQNNQPVEGEVVEFSTTLGSMAQSSDTTDNDGVAQSVLISGSTPGLAKVTADYKNEYSRSVTVVFDSVSTESIQFGVSKPTMLADGIDSISVVVSLLDENGNPAKNKPVQFSATAGRFLKPVAYTDSTGNARNQFRSYASQFDSTAILHFTTTGLALQTVVEIRGVDFQLKSLPNYLIANGTSQSEITGILKETTSKVAIPNAEVIFATDRGTIPWHGMTGQDGVVRVSLTSDTELGAAQVIGQYGEGIYDTTYVDFIRSEPAHLYITVDPHILPADNNSSAGIQVRVTDVNNDPVPDGTSVRFTIVEGSGAVDPVLQTESGIVKNQLVASNHPDTTVVQIQSGGIKDSIQVVYQVGETASIEVTADSSSIPADGITTTAVHARVLDVAGNPVRDGTSVQFQTSIGNITSEAVTSNGEAVAQFSSNETGIAVIRASVGSIYAETTVNLRPGKPASVLMSFDPNSLGVRDSGRNQTVRITADVRDSKNNTVSDGTLVRFSIFASPGGGESLSSYEPIPTVNGISEVSLLSGIRSGTVRIQAEVVDSNNNPVVPPVRAISTEIIIFAGPPYIENVNDRSTSHLTVGSSPVNILGWHHVNNTATIVAVVGDKYNNPVPVGTAVYFTTSAGVISTHTGYTNDEGIASVTIHSAQPYPTIDRFYHTFYDPNINHPDFNLPDGVIPGPIPDYERSQVLNSEGDYVENDGIVRVLASTEGVDPNDQKSAVWAVCGVVFSGLIYQFSVDISTDSISPGESVHIPIEIYDVNGNPIVPESMITADASAGSLSWTSLVTSDPGVTYYDLYLTNNLDPNNPDARETSTYVTIKVTSPNGNAVRSTPSIRLLLE